MTQPAGADAPADGSASSGRIVVVVDPPKKGEVREALAGAYPEGIERVLGLIATQMPAAEVENVWAFPGVRREGREYGVVVVSRTMAESDRKRVYRARYTLDIKGERRGAATMELEEVAETPADMAEKVIAGVSRRADEAGDAELLDLSAWRGSLMVDGESLKVGE